MINVQKLLMYIGVLLVVIGVPSLTSCRTPRYVPLPSSHQRDSTHLASLHRLDSIYYSVHDSMSIRFARGVVPSARSTSGAAGLSGASVPSGAAGISGTAGPPPDTVFIDRWHTVFRDRTHTLTHHDTVTLTLHDSVPYPVYIPSPSPSGEGVQGVRLRFYKHCTLGFFLILLALLAYIAIRFYLHR